MGYDGLLVMCYVNGLFDALRCIEMMVLFGGLGLLLVVVRE